MNSASESLRYESEPLSRPMGPPPPPLRRRSAPSPEPSGASLHASNMDDSMKIGSPWLRTDKDLDDIDQSSRYDEDSDATVGPASDKQDSPTRSLPSVLAPLQQRAISPTSFSSYNCNYGKSSYTDISAPHLADALENRLEVMRFKNAAENYHCRIPPEDAPPHMQMMVLLYQWAAWALEIADKKKCEEMLKWVNGRTLDFMMSGGRIPGYNLKELLEIAGVDPRELYRNGGQPVQHGRSMAEMDSSQLAARMSAEQPTENLTTFKAAARQSRTEGLDQDNEALDANLPTMPSGQQKRLINPDDGEEDIQDTGEIDHTGRESAAPYRKNNFKEHDELFPSTASAMAHEGPSNWKREFVFDVEHLDQNIKRQKTGAESTKQDCFASNEQNDVDRAISPRATDTTYPVSRDEAQREKYQQTFFKAQLNAVLKTHRQSQFRKDLPSWSELLPRLRHSKLSAKTIALLRDDFDSGWKTWDGSAFSQLPEYLRSSDQEEKPKGKSPSAPPSKASPTSAIPARARVIAKDQTKTKTQSGAQKRIAEEDYDSGDGEWTAKRTSVTTRRQASQPSALTKKRGGARRGVRKA